MYPLGTKIPVTVVANWFTKDIARSVIGARAVIGIDHFDKLDDVRQRILVNLTFNLGPAKLREFKRFLAAYTNHSWETAAKELENSLWYKQVGRRGPEMCAAVRTGKYSWQ
jgi:lysozyme